MSAGSNKDVIRDLVNNGWNKTDISVFQRIFSDQFQDHTAPFGSDGSKASFLGMVQGIQSSMSDVALHLEDMVSEGDKIAWRWTFEGRHTGPFMGIPATGNMISFGGMNIDRIENGQIVERWARMDAMTLMQQLGVAPAPAH